MACYDDLPGVWMTVQALRSYHRDILHQCELIVVDNSPKSEHGISTKNLVESWVRGDFLRARYVPFTEYNSTSKPRQLVFDLAEAPNVLVMDSHVMLPRKAGTESSLKKLIDWYDQNPDTYNLVQGVMMYDDLKGFSTHFQDVIREEMWGIWGSDPQGEFEDNPPFEIMAHGLGLFSARKDAWSAVGGFHPLHRGFGGEEWYIHEKFRNYGTKNLKDGRTLCMPFLRWLHRFGHPNGVKYPLSILDKVRNNLIHFKDLGRPVDRLIKHFIGMQNEDGTKRSGPVVTVDQWNWINRNPEQYPIPVQVPFDNPPPGYIPAQKPCSVGNNSTTNEPPKNPTQGMVEAPLPSDVSLDEMAKFLKDRKDGYCELSDDVRRLVAEANKESGILFLLSDRASPALVAAAMVQPSEIDVQWMSPVQGAVHQFDRNIFEKLPEFMEKESIGTFIKNDLTANSAEIDKAYFDFSKSISDIEDFPGWDTVFIQGVIHADRLHPLLTALVKTATRIVIFGTVSYREGAPARTGEEGKFEAGIWPVLRYIFENHPEWSMLQVSNEGAGFSVISRRESDRKKLPSTAKMGWNFVKAMTSFVASGAEFTTPEEYKTRLQICSTCTFRADDRCSACGCFIEAKAKIASTPCPLGFWNDKDLREQIRTVEFSAEPPVQ